MSDDERTPVNAAVSASPAYHDVERRLQALEAKVQELEAMLGLAMRLLSLEEPVSVLLRRYGATESEEHAVHQLLDTAAVRAAAGGMYNPSFNAFVDDLYDRLPAVRGDRQFVELLLDTLKLDRPAYRQLHTWMVAREWPEWS